MDAVGEEKLKEAFVRVANRVIADRDAFVKQMTENIEKIYREKVSEIDVEATDSRLGELRKEMSSLVKLNLTSGVDSEIYAVEYDRINGEMEDLRSKQSVITRAETARRETLGKVQEIAKFLREMDNLQEFDEGLFGMLVERIKVMNIVQAEFVLRSGIGVIEIIWCARISLVLSTGEIPVPERSKATPPGIESWVCDWQQHELSVDRATIGP